MNTIARLQSLPYYIGFFKCAKELRNNGVIRRGLSAPDPDGELKKVKQRFNSAFMKCIRTIGISNLDAVPEQDSAPVEFELLDIRKKKALMHNNKEMRFSVDLSASMNIAGFVDSISILNKDDLKRKYVNGYFRRNTRDVVLEDYEIATLVLKPRFVGLLSGGVNWYIDNENTEINYSSFLFSPFLSRDNGLIAVSHRNENHNNRGVNRFRTLTSEFFIEAINRYERMLRDRYPELSEEEIHNMLDAVTTLDNGRRSFDYNFLEVTGTFKSFPQVGFDSYHSFLSEGNLNCFSSRSSIHPSTAMIGLLTCGKHGVKGKYINNFKSAINDISENDIGYWQQVEHSMTGGVELISMPILKTSMHEHRGLVSDQIMHTGSLDVSALHVDSKTRKFFIEKPDVFNDMWRSALVLIPKSAIDDGDIDLSIKFKVSFEFMMNVTETYLDPMVSVYAFKSIMEAYFGSTKWNLNDILDFVNERNSDRREEDE